MKVRHFVLEMPRRDKDKIFGKDKALVDYDKDGDTIIIATPKDD